MPSLSVVTITYNDESGLRATMKSLLPAAELISEWIVVDSSPELSAPVLAEASGKFEIKHISLPPSGIYPAMNAGLSAANSESVWFLNSGDSLHDAEILNRCLKQLANCDAVCAEARLMRNGRFEYSVPPPADFWAGVRFGNRICHQAIIYNRKAFADLFPYSEVFRLAADFELHVRAAKQGKRLLPVAGKLVDFDTSGASSNTGPVLGEFAEIARLQGDFGLRAGVLLETLRVGVVKFVGKSQIGSRLRPLWVAFKQGNSK